MGSKSSLFGPHLVSFYTFALRESLYFCFFFPRNGAFHQNVNFLSAKSDASADVAT